MLYLVLEINAVSSRGVGSVDRSVPFSAGRNECERLGTLSSCVDTIQSI